MWETKESARTEGHEVQDRVAHCRPYCNDGWDDICGMEEKTITSKTVWPNLHDLQSSFSCPSHIITLKIWSLFIASINKPLLNNAGQEETMTPDRLQFEREDNTAVLKVNVNSLVAGKLQVLVCCPEFTYTQ